MGVMSEIDRQLQEIRTIVADDCEPGTPQQLVEERVDRLVNETIDLSMLALDPEQRPLIEREARGIAQILLRCKLMLSTFNGEDVEQIRRLIVALEIPTRPLGKLSVVSHV